MPNKRPLRGEVCSVKIEGRLKDDENVVFEREDHFTFQLGDGEVRQSPYDGYGSLPLPSRQIPI
jgi:hypothetical protein